MVQSPLNSGTGHFHRAVSGNQYCQLEVQIHQSDRETVEGQCEPGLGYCTVPGYAVANKVVYLFLFLCDTQQNEVT